MLVFAAVLTGVLAMHTAGHAADAGAPLGAHHAMAAMADMPGMAADPGSAALATLGPATYDPATYDPAAYDPAAYDPPRATGVGATRHAGSHGDPGCSLAAMCLALLSAAAAAALGRPRTRTTAAAVDPGPARTSPAGALSRPRPPSLAVLSVCRT